MPVPEALTVIAAALTIAKNIYGATTGIYVWIEGVKHADKTVGDLAEEVFSLRETLQAAESLLSSEVVRHAALVETDEESRELWFSLFATLQDCRNTIDSLEKLLMPIRTSAGSAILQKLKLDLAQNEITVTRQQMTFHTKRLHMSIQMVHLRISCLGPTLINANVDSRMDKLQALIQTQMDLLVELTKTTPTSANMHQSNFEACARSLGRSAQNLLATSASLYTGSQYEGSITSNDGHRQAVYHWVTDVSLPDTELMHDVSAALPQVRIPNHSTSPRANNEEAFSASYHTTTISRSSSHDSIISKLASGRDRRAEYLFSRGINVNALNFDPSQSLKVISLAHLKDKKPLSAEMEGGIMLLMELDADPTVPFAASELSEKTKEAKGLTVLNIVCLLGWDTVLSSFLRKGVSPDAGSTSMLYSAASAGRVSTVQKLITADTRLSWKTPTHTSQSPLHIAAQNGHLDVVRIMVENGTPVDSMTRIFSRLEGIPGQICTSKTPLLLAVENNRQSVVKFLLESGANVEHPCVGRRPLFQACYLANVEVVHILIEGKADINAKNSAGNSVLHTAIPESLTDDITSCSRDTLNMRIELAQRCRQIVKALLAANAKPYLFFNSDMKKFDKFGKKIEKWNQAHPEHPVMPLDLSS